jgi:hypothetical protein
MMIWKGSFLAARFDGRMDHYIMIWKIKIKNWFLAEQIRILGYEE